MWSCYTKPTCCCLIFIFPVFKSLRTEKAPDPPGWYYMEKDFWATLWWRIDGQKDGCKSSLHESVSQQPSQRQVLVLVTLSLKSSALIPNCNQSRKHKPLMWELLASSRTHYNVTFSLWEQFRWNCSGIVWISPGFKCGGDGGVCVRSKWGTFSFWWHLDWTSINHTHMHTLRTHPLPSSQIHVCHWAPSGYAGSGKTSRAKFRKQLREITAHQWTEFQLHFEYVSVSQKVSLVKSLTPRLETTKEEKQHSCMLKI